MSWGRNARHGFDRALQTADKLKSAVVFFFFFVNQRSLPCVVFVGDLGK